MLFKSNRPIYVSYYTKNTAYEKVMNTFLLPSLKKFNLTYDIKGIDNLGNWNLNTSYKANFMLEMLEKHKKDIVFLDSDATVMKYPNLFEQIPPMYDIALHFLDWYLMWRNKRGFHKRELLSGTMLFRYNSRVISMTKKYIEECQKTSQWEQRVLQRVLNKDRKIKIYNLPPQYCAIIRRDGKVPQFMQEPVILHHQVSRKLKNENK